MRREWWEVYYLIEATYTEGPERWFEVDLGNVLFDGMSYRDNVGARGQRFREMLRPCSPISDLWQRSGITGFERREDALTVLSALRKLSISKVEKAGRMRFRLTKRVSTQHSQVVAG